jgi:hypothetical protein
MRVAVGLFAVVICSCAPAGRQGPIAQDGALPVGTADGAAGTSVDTAPAQTQPDAAAPADTAVADDRPAAHDAAPGVEAGPAPVAWWDAAWSRRRWIALDNAAGTEDLENFPVPVLLDATRASGAAASGKDLRFVDAAGAVLSHETDEWSAGGTSVVWVRVPKLTAGSARQGFWMYSGNPAADALPASSSSATWAAPYAAVWHFAGTATDATATRRQAESHVRFAAGRVGRAAAFDSGTKEYVKLPNDTNLVSGASAVTVSMWVQHVGVVRDNQDIILGVGTASTTGHLSRVSIAVSPQLGFVSEANPDEGPYEVLTSAANVAPNGEWHHFAAVIDVAAKTMTVYKDGAQLGTPYKGKWTAKAFPTTPSNRITIGCEEDLSKSYFNGMIDELRVQLVARSPAWIATEARALKDPAFVSFAAPEEQRP